jgi:uncharacterized membrane protein
MFSKARLDALGDGIFGVAMTLLVLDVRLPEDFQPQTSADLLHGLVDLAPKFLPYALSFFVLGIRWQWEAEERQGSEARILGRGYVQLWLLLLFLVTCMPFTTIVIGRYFDIPAAIWLYVANLAALSVLSFALAAGGREPGQRPRSARIVGLTVLLVSCAAAVVASFFSTQLAAWALALNFLAPIAGHWRPGARSVSPPTASA